MEAYLQEKGDYANAEGIEPIGKNKELGKFLVDIDCMAESLAEPFKRPDLSKSSLMISVVGVPHAGILALLYIFLKAKICFLLDHDRGLDYTLLALLLRILIKKINFSSQHGGAAK